MIVDYYRRRMIVDTNALSSAAMAIPVIVLGEYRYGIAQSRNRTHYESWLIGLLHDCFGTRYHRPTTQYYAEIVLEPKRKGKTNPHQRPLIAALCRQHGLPPAKSRPPF